MAEGDAEGGTAGDEAADRGGTAGVGDDPLAAWAVGTLHATLFMLVPVGAAHAAGALGDLLAGVGTVAAVALFALVWAAVWAASRRWLRDADPDRPLGTVTGGATWGAAAGLGVLPGVVLAVLVATGNLPLAALLLLAGAVVAPLVGGASGALLAVVDLVLLRTARLAAPA
ncbi:MAG: hypothetical protein ABEJ61_04460 [Haloferacaceae archaeon]